MQSRLQTAVSSRASGGRCGDPIEYVTDLSIGANWFFFALDLVANGDLDAEALFFAALVTVDREKP